MRCSQVWKGKKVKTNTCSSRIILILSKTEAGIVNMLHALKDGAAVLFHIFQIVTFTIQPSALILLTIAAIKWQTHKISYTQKGVCRDKWGSRCQKSISQNSYFGRKIWTDRSEDIWHLGQRGGNCSSWDTREWGLGCKLISPLILDSSSAWRTFKI